MRAVQERATHAGDEIAPCARCSGSCGHGRDRPASAGAGEPLTRGLEGGTPVNQEGADAQVPIRGLVHAGRRQGRPERGRDQQARRRGSGRRERWRATRELLLRLRRPRRLRDRRPSRQRERRGRRAHRQRRRRRDGEDRGAADAGGGRRRREAIGRLPAAGLAGRGRGRAQGQGAGAVGVQDRQGRRACAGRAVPPRPGARGVVTVAGGPGVAGAAQAAHALSGCGRWRATASTGC